MYFQVRAGWVKAVDGVSLDVARGETVGLVGESGCGKTSLAYAITQLLPTNAYILGGQVFFGSEEKMASLRPQYLGLAEERMWRDLQAVRAEFATLEKSIDPEASERRKALVNKMASLEYPLSATYRRYLGPEIAQLSARRADLQRRMESGTGRARQELRDVQDRLSAATCDGDLIDVTRRPQGRLREYHPKLSAVRWRQISIVFQGAMNALNPVYTVGEQIIEAIRTHENGSAEAARRRVEGLFRLVGIPVDRIDNFPHEYSGGMKQRAMIAMALCLNPKLVIMDEPTTALDVITAARIMDEVLRIQNELKMTIIIISHDVSVVAKVADRIAVMYAGKIVEEGSTKDVFRSILHPYTHGLLGAFPSIEGPKVRLKSIPGSPPSLVNPPPACRFHPRCTYAKDVCRLVVPVDAIPSPGHRALCHFSNDFHARGGLGSL